MHGRNDERRHGNGFQRTAKKPRLLIASDRATMDIQPYTAARAAEIADLFHRAVHAIDPSLYSAEQQEAWAPTPPDYAQWAQRLNETRPFMAIIAGRVVGFMELDDAGRIDCAYTHPDFQGQGVASALYRYLLAEAKRRGIGRLSVEASLAARSFFAHRGFSVVATNEVPRRGVALVNLSMVKDIAPDD